MKHSRALELFWNFLALPKDQKNTEKLNFFKLFPFFQGLSARELKMVESILFRRTYEENEYLFEVHQPGAALFFIETGEVSIEIPQSPHEFTQVAKLLAGHFVGELALLDNSPRSASARAICQTHTFALFRNDLIKLVNSHPEIAVHIYRGLANIVGDRLKATNELIHAQSAA